MAQLRFQNYNRPLVSFDESRRTIGLAIPGVYCGWDRITNIAGNSITISHDLTGVFATEADNSSRIGPLGLAVSNHGVEVYEDSPVVLNVNYNAGNAFVRVDWVIMNHNYLASPGGTPAIYSVVQGQNGIDFGEPVALPNPATHVIIAKIYIPASAANLSAIAYIKKQSPKLGGYGFNKLSEDDIQAWGNQEAVINDLDLVRKTCIVSTYTDTINLPIASRFGTVIVLKKGVYITQLFSDMQNGKSYSRSSVDGGANWQPWQNLNNSDVVVDFTPINTQIGSRNYTHQYFVANGQSLTASIDALDIEAESVLNALSTTNTNVTNLSSSIGNKIYASQFNITNGETITASLNKLDLAIGNRQYSINNLLVDGESITASLEKLDIALKPAWTDLTLINGWQGNTGGMTYNAGYRVLKDGTVELRGVLIAPIGGGLAVTGAIAPITPLNNNVGLCIQDGGNPGTTLILAISSTGVLTIGGYLGTHLYSIEGMRYLHS